MKRIILFITITALSLNTYSQQTELIQIAGAKLKNNIVQAKELAESIIQYEEIIEQSKILGEMRDMYNEISEGVKKYGPVKNSLMYMYGSINLYTKTINEVQNKKKSNGSAYYNKNSVKALDQKMLSIIENNTNNIKDLKAIMKSGEMKMNDGERMALANEIETRTKNNYLQIQKINRLLIKTYKIY